MIYKKVSTDIGCRRSHARDGKTIFRSSSHCEEATAGPKTEQNNNLSNSAQEATLPQRETASVKMRVLYSHATPSNVRASCQNLGNERVLAYGRTCFIVPLGAFSKRRKDDPSRVSRNVIGSLCHLDLRHHQPSLMPQQKVYCLQRAFA